MTVNTQNINTKSVLKYVFLPGIIPRAKELATGGFGYLAFLIASVFGAVRIFPAGHPYLDPANIGKFTILKTVAAAANNIELSRRNLDQVVVFIAILTAIALLFMQFLLLLITFFSGQAFAGGGGVTWTSMFVTEFPQTDIAFLMLDYVFGIPGAGGGATTFFGSNALQATGGPTPFHSGLHALFQFYNLAILLVGVLIFMYFVIVVVIETAQTGVPFGRRFSKLYAPFRLVIAIGLLVPLPPTGFNMAQFITLYAAKIGSSFATNGWLLYNENLQDTNMNPVGISSTSLVARPRSPQLDGLIHFSAVYHACREMYAIYAPRDANTRGQGVCINPYIIVNGQARLFTRYMGAACPSGATGGWGAEFSYAEAKEIFGKADVEVILGELDPVKHSQDAGGVHPYCGKITISLGHDNPPYFDGGPLAPVAGGNAPLGQQGVRAIEEGYYNIVRIMLNPNFDAGFLGIIGTVSGTGFDSGNFANFMRYGERTARASVPARPPIKDACIHSAELGDADTCGNDTSEPPSSTFQESLNTLRVTMAGLAGRSYTTYRNSLNLALTDELAQRGWGGAGIWYNQIADLNGTFTGAIYATPSVRQFPKVMEKVKEQKETQDKSTGFCDTFDPNLGDGISVDLNANEFYMIKAMNRAYKYFACEDPNKETGDPAAASAASTTQTAGCGADTPQQQGGTTKGMTTNVFMDVVSLVFGLNGLFDLRACSRIDEATGQPIVHPLAQLSTVGKSLVENAIRSMGMALGASFGGGMIGVLGNSAGPALQSLSGVFVGIATIGLTAGFILYYILPFLPFIYFFFAVGSWVKSIFEAMVGVPLWALAHLHIDGDGLPGKAAMPGYFLILEIFLRPIVTVFGLIGGVACFGALTIALNNLFDLVVMNNTGALPGESDAGIPAGELESLRRGTIDQFFFTIMYAILVYLMATASFKMIDTVPRGIMRWMNPGVTTFNDNKGDPTSDLTTYAAIGGSQATRQIFSGMTQGASGLGQTVGAGLKAAMGDEAKK